MPNKRFTWLCLAALLALVPATGSAAVRPWLAGSIGGSTFAMGDVNDLVGVVNDELAATGLSMDDITHGYNFGLGIGVDVAHNFSVGLGYDRVDGMSEVALPNGKVELKVPANLYRAFGRYTLPLSDKASGFLEASLGRVTSDATMAFSGGGLSPELTGLKGSGMAFEGGGGVDFTFESRFGLFAMASYRSANADDIEAYGEKMYDAGGGSFSLDWSGVVVRLGLSVALTD
jgi:hypothetical protein